MKLTRFCIREIGIPFVAGFKHALASRNRTSSVLLEIGTDEGIAGWGEGTPRSYVCGESVATVVDALKRIAALLCGFDLKRSDAPTKTMEWIESAFSGELERHPSAKCALELALLDLHGKMARKPALDFFGSLKNDRIFYSAVLSDDSLPKTKKMLEMMAPVGFRDIKVKVGDDIEKCIETIALIRSVLSPDITIRIDANGSWDLDAAVGNIELFCDHGVVNVEQPMPVGLKRQYPALMRAIGRRALVVLDESICTYEDALWFIDNKGARGFNLKISKHGGLRATLKIRRLASMNDIFCQLGCHVGETSILTQAGRIFAGVSQDLRAASKAMRRRIWRLSADPRHCGSAAALRPSGRISAGRPENGGRLGNCDQPLAFEACRHTFVSHPLTAYRQAETVSFKAAGSTVGERDRDIPNRRTRPLFEERKKYGIDPNPWNRLFCAVRNFDQPRFERHGPGHHGRMDCPKNGHQ